MISTVGVYEKFISRMRTRVFQCSDSYVLGTEAWVTIFLLLFSFRSTSKVPRRASRAYDIMQPALQDSATHKAAGPFSFWLLCRRCTTHEARILAAFLFPEST